MLVYHIAIGYKWAENYDKAYARYAEEKLAESHIAMYEFIMVVVAEMERRRKVYVGE